MYAFFDGDDIGPKLEYLLLNNRLEEASLFSESINTAMSNIRTYLKNTGNITVHILGGDDILLQYDKSVDDGLLIGEIRGIFETQTGCTMSCGTGSDLNQTLWNLHKAKLFGKDNINGYK